MIEGIIFDLDGVLVTPESSPKRECEKKALEHFDISFSKDDFSQYKGLSPTEKIQKIVRDSESEVAPERVIQKKLEIHLKQMEGIEAVENAPQLVRKISSDYRLAVASNSEREVVEKAIEILDLGDEFDVIVSSDDVERGKPNPEIFLTAAEKLGTQPEETIVLDDSEVGVKGATEGGFVSIGFDLDDSENCEVSAENVREFEQLIHEID